jgi:hypothetical protein
MTTPKETKSAAAKSIVISVLLIVVAGYVPAIIMGALGWKSAVSLAMLGGMATFLACTMGKGWHTGLIIAVPFSVFTALIVWSAPYALLAAIVMAGAAFLRGYGGKVGLHNALMMTVISLGFILAQPPKPVGTFAAPIFAGLVMLATTLWVTLIVFLAKRWVHPPKLQSLVAARVVAFGVVLGIMIGIASWCVVHFELGHGGAWIILTILVVFQPYLGAGIKKAGARAAGTVAGFVIAIVVGLFFSGGAVLYVIGSILLVVALVFMMTGKPYWLFATFLTPAIVLYDSAGATVEKVAVERLEATIVGVLGTLVVMLALTPIAKRLALKAGQTEY